MTFDQSTKIEEISQVTVRVKENLNVKDEIISYMRSAIINGEFKPGEKLHESTLSRKFGASRSPIREALVQLEQEGLVETFPKKGSIITKISRSQLRQAQFIRTALESRNIEILTESITPEQIERLYRNLDRQFTSIENNDYFESYAAMDEFHFMLCDFSQLPRIWETIRKDKIPLDRLHALNQPHNPRMSILYQDHIDIVTALESKNPKLCVKLITEHVAIDFEAMHLVDETD